MKAMILAAGRGERMRPLTDTCPKPLLMAGEKSLIEYQISRLVDCGITEIVINHAWLGNMIEEKLGDGSKYGAKILYSAEKEALETGGGIAKALHLLGDDPFWVVSSDVWSYIHFNKVIAPKDSQVHLLMVANPVHNSQGDFTLNTDGKVGIDDGEKLTYSGAGVFSPSQFKKYIIEKFPLRTVIEDAIKQQKCTGETYNGTWIDIGTPARLAIIKQQIENGLGFP